MSHLPYHHSVSSRVVNPWVEGNALGLYSFLCELFGGGLLASPTSQEPPHSCLLRNIHQSSICLGLQTLNNLHKIDVTLRISQSANKLMKARNLLRGTQSVKWGSLSWTPGLSVPMDKAPPRTLFSSKGWALLGDLPDRRQLPITTVSLTLNTFHRLQKI